MHALDWHLEVDLNNELRKCFFIFKTYLTCLAIFTWIFFGLLNNSGPKKSRVNIINIKVLKTKQIILTSVLLSSANINSCDHEKTTE
ncbi:hypothetical protein BpHYR1_015378 [Brachionus plicatilis]|uniref:Uncharacterized protein n=1 Tax=Brachionus plicatilis TaxID=10195 RepID=A0A3M7PFU2_BRAPC|nr:hypothetical protein BpHYR1_015378 [Brachionus plicatilis]